MRARGTWGLPVLAGALLAIGPPPAGLVAPAFVGLVPLLLLLDELPDTARGRWVAVRAGLVTGVVYFGIQLYWICVALLRESLLAVPAYLATVGVLAGLVAGFAWAVHYSGARLGLPLAVRAAIFWTALEWVQAHAGDLAFPWLGLGAALTPVPALAGAADLVGTRGLTLWIAACNGLLAQALIRYRAGARPLPATAGLLVVLAIPAAYGLVRSATLVMRPAADVALIQSSLPPAAARDGAAGLDTALSTLIRLTDGLTGPPPDLVAWPEMALPTVLRDDPRLARVRSVAGRLGAPVVVGAYGRTPGGALTNAAIVVDPHAPTVGRYDKRRLVPFVERVPFIGARRVDTGRPGDRWFGALAPGPDHAAPAVAGGARYGILICYESIFGALAADYRARGADFLVNITNDAWYGHEGRWGRTAGLWQHPAHLVLRAIETRTGVARAANQGFSMFVDPTGRVRGATTLFSATATRATVLTTDGTTLYVRWGDWLATLAAALALVTLLAAARSRPYPTPRSTPVRRPRHPSGSPPR